MTEPKKVPFIATWPMRLFGLPDYQQEALYGTSAATILTYMAIALVFYSMFFTVTTIVFCNSLLGMTLLMSCLVGGTVGTFLFLIDRVTLIRLWLDPNRGLGLLWLVRITTFTTMLMVAILGAVVHFQDDITRIQGNKVSQAVTASITGTGEYVHRIQLERQKIEDATRALERKAGLERSITETTSRLAVATAEAAYERGGSFDPMTGKARPKGPGEIYQYQLGQISIQEQNIAAMRAELSKLGDPAQLIVDAKQALIDIQAEAMKKASAKEKGAAKKVDALWILVQQELSARLIVMYYLLLSMIPDMAMLLAMQRFSTLSEARTRLKAVEDERDRAKNFLAFTKEKEAIAAQRKPIVIRVTHNTKKSQSQKPDHDPGPQADKAEEPLHTESSNDNDKET